MLSFKIIYQPNLPIIKTILVRYPDNDIFFKQVGARVKQLRLERELSQRELGFKAELEKSVIQRIERGAINSTLRTLVRISNALDVDMSELFNFSSLK